MQVSIIGSGNVGANTAFFLLEQGGADVAIYDIRDGTAEGKALDMMEAAPVRGYRQRLRILAGLEGLEDGGILVIAAGTVRHPGMKRDDLFQTNKGVVAGIAEEVARVAPASRVIVTTEPVDLMTEVFVRSSGFARERVMGLGGFLDATRLRHAIARELGGTVDDVSTLVIGRHGDAMLCLPEYTRVAGVPVEQLLSSERIQALVDETRQAGDLIVGLAQRSSAYYAPSAAAAELVDAMLRDLRRIIPVSLLLNGEYGLSGVCLSLPGVIGRTGIERVLLPRLTQAQTEQLSRSAVSVQELAQGGEV